MLERVTLLQEVNDLFDMSWKSWWIRPIFIISCCATIPESAGEAHRISEESDGPCPMCPYFINTPTNVTAPQGIPANLTCGVRNLSDRKVSWIRREDLHVLTTGTFTYTTDVRFRVIHLEGSPYWTLEVGSPTINDSGVYECQVSTQPKIYRRFTLNVIVPRAEITGNQQIYMKAGSDINITCAVAGAVRGAPVKWYHVLPKPRNGVSTIELNIGERGGVQVVTDKNAGTSRLLVTVATWKDAGNYTCDPIYGVPSSVSVHVLDEETPAAMQHDLQPTTSGCCGASTLSLSLIILLTVTLYISNVILAVEDEGLAPTGSLSAVSYINRRATTSPVFMTVSVAVLFVVVLMGHLDACQLSTDVFNIITINPQKFIRLCGS